MFSIAKILENYKLHLKSESTDRFKMFCVLAKSNPESARAEAVVFSMLNSNRLQVENHEDVSSGGPDFICRSNENNFLVEVSCLDTNSVAKESNIPNDISTQAGASTYNAITRLLRRKSSSKARQLSNQPLPRILAITTEHSAGDILLDGLAAERLLASDPKISVHLAQSNPITELTTDLKESVFFRFSQDGKVESCRESISALLLVSIAKNSCTVLGVLNPEPAIKFDIELLPSIPFIRISPWPIEENRIHTEWVVNSPEPKKFFILLREIRQLPKNKSNLGSILGLCITQVFCGTANNRA